MKKGKAAAIGFFLLMICCLFPAGETQAATAKRLFSLVVNDGFVEQTIPVYRYTSGNSSYVAAKKSLRTFYVYAGSKSVSVKITGKTALYKKLYKSLTYKKKAALSATTSLNYTVKSRNGKKETFQLKLLRPSMPKVTSLSVSPNSSTGFTPGNYNRMSVKLKTSAKVAVKTYFKITNSNGKLVYTKVLGTKKSASFTDYWDGRPSAKNAAGLSASDYVPAGRYTLTAWLQYQVGGRNKYIKKSVPVTVKGQSSSENGGDKKDEKPANSSFQAKNWNWTVQLSGDDTLDYLAEVVCQQVLTNSMSEVERAKALYTWYGKNIVYKRGSAPSSKDGQKSYMDVTSESAKAAIAAYGKQADAMIAQGRAVVNVKDNLYPTKGYSVSRKISVSTWNLVKRYGDCIVMAGTYETLLRHAGISADLILNTLKSGESPGRHCWNIVKIGGKYYYADANQITNSYETSGHLGYTFFLGGTDTFYQYKLYSTVQTNVTLVKPSQVSKKDCPGK